MYAKLKIHNFSKSEGYYNPPPPRVNIKGFVTFQLPHKNLTPKVLNLPKFLLPNLFTHIFFDPNIV